MYFKVHKGQHSDVLAVCDENILGKTFEEGKYCITISEHFYKGQKGTALTITPLLRDIPNVNLIGKEAVALGLKVEIITKENIIVIAGVPHAQAYAQ
ncbi:DUF424 family protein [Candidatus Woesearchaeota archaeon]|nr:DUF424 family protein [Candidatus Woesearchaeota archaeon]